MTVRGVVGLPIDELQGLISRRSQTRDRAAVNGFAIGGGNVLATLCDLTIAADTRAIRTGRTEGRLRRRGLGHGLAGPPRRRQEGRAKIWFINDRYTPPNRRVNWASSTRVVPSRRAPDAAVKDWTDKLAQRSPTAIAAGKALLQRPDSDNIRGISKPRPSCREAVLRYGGNRRKASPAFNEKRAAGLPQIHLAIRQ